MINELQLYEKIWSRAEARAASTPVYEYSHRKEAANQVGSLGEIVAEEWFNANNIQFSDERLTTHDYRFMNGKTMDIKTKDRTVRPQYDYDCSVPLYNHEHQIPEYYLFVSLWRERSNKSNDIRRFHTAFVLGYITQPLLEQNGVIWRAGETDPSNGTKFWTDCINVKVSDLMEFTNP